jgi:3-hydroxybutyryl-CoA dehydratase
MKFDELFMGQVAEFTKTVTETDIVMYAGITGDFNPMHVDEVAASKTRFRSRIAHGMLTAGFISACLGMKLPGPGAIYLSQTLRFRAPVRIGDTITARLEVTELVPEKKRLKLSTTCLNGLGEVVIDGEATVMMLE